MNKRKEILLEAWCLMDQGIRISRLRTDEIDRIVASEPFKDFVSTYINQSGMVRQYLSDNEPEEYEHTTHWVCAEQLEKYGRNALCCECTDHECED